jgi:hypothetical protein
MKAIGAILLVVGLLFGIVALNMDTSVATEAQSIGGIDIPSVRVNNLGLMDQRRNYLMVAAVGAVVGVLLVAAGSMQTASHTAVGETRQCPYCAEDVKVEAVICRFCGRDLPDIPESAADEPSGQLAEEVPSDEDSFASWD